jgi:hypothetical protein
LEQRWSKGIDVRYEGVERKAAQMRDKHGLGKFHAMLAPDCTCHVRSKCQTKGYRLVVNHLKSLWTRKLSIRAKTKGYGLAVNHLKNL